MVDEIDVESGKVTVPVNIELSSGANSAVVEFKVFKSAVVA